MMTKTPRPQYTPELRERAVRMVREHRKDHPSLWAAIEALAPMFGCVPQTLNEWVKKAETDAGQRPGLTSDERAKMKAMEREIKQLRQANEILRKASAFFAQAELDRKPKS
jgi:transposase